MRCTQTNTWINWWSFSLFIDCAAIVDMRKNTGMQNVCIVNMRWSDISLDYFGISQTILHLFSTENLSKYGMGTQKTINISDLGWSLMIWCSWSTYWTNQGSFLHIVLTVFYKTWCYQIKKSVKSQNISKIYLWHHINFFCVPSCPPTSLD